MKTIAILAMILSFNSFGAFTEECQGVVKGIFIDQEVLIDQGKNIDYQKLSEDYTAAKLICEAVYSRLGSSNSFSQEVEAMEEDCQKAYGSFTYRGKLNEILECKVNGLTDLVN